MAGKAGTWDTAVEKGGKIMFESEKTNVDIATRTKTTLPTDK